MVESIELLPPPAAAARLGVAAGTLAKWRQLGTGPAYRKIGVRVLYPAVELAAFVATQPLRRCTSDAQAPSAPSNARPTATTAERAPAAGRARRARA